jgi:hypothetical protein
MIRSPYFNQRSVESDFCWNATQNNQKVPMAVITSGPLILVLSLMYPKAKVTTREIQPATDDRALACKATKR